MTVKPVVLLLASGVAMAAGAAVYSWLSKRTTPLLAPLLGETPKTVWIFASDVHGISASEHLPEAIRDTTLRVEVTAAPYDPAQPDVWRGSATSAYPPDGSGEIPLPGGIVVSFDRHQVQRSLYA